MQKENKASDSQPVKVHQCPTCFTIYDERFDDSVNDIPVGVKFTDLPSTYCCSVCEEAKSEFVEVNVKELLM